jgi:hypothetical protein
MSSWQDRIADANEKARPLVERLRSAAEDQGYEDDKALEEAVAFAAGQLDPDEDDYETWEATVLARLDDTFKTGER